MRTLPFVLLLLALGVTGCGGKKDALILLEELPNVGKIEIRNNQAVSESDIKAVMVLKESTWRFWTRSKFSRFQFEQDKRAILTLYLRRGYPRARIQAVKLAERENAVDLTITISEGEHVQVAGVRIDVDAPTQSRGEFGIHDEVLTLRGGDPFDPIQVGVDERVLQRKMAERGFMRAKSTGNAQFSGSQAFLHYRLEPGDPYRVSSIDIKGLRGIQERSLRGFLEIEPGDLFNITDINKSQRNLMRGGYFLSVRSDTVGVDPLNRTVGLEFRVRERKLKWVEGGIGFNSEQQVLLNAAWGNRSFARSGLRTVFRDRVEFDFNLPESISSNLFEVILNKQAFLSTRWAFQPNGFWEYINDQVEVVETEESKPSIGSYTQNIFGAATAFRRQIGSEYNQVVLSLENRWVYNEADSVAQASDSLLARDFYQTRLLRTSVDFDTRNNFFNPTRGGYFSFVGEFAGGALGGATSFNKFTLGSTRFWPLGENGTLGIRGEIGFAIPTGKDPELLDAERVPREDRYAVGGAYSVRGFDERELDGRGQYPGGLSGGTVQSLLNVETRWTLVNPVAAVLFLDSGNVWQDREDFGLARYVPRGDPDDVSPHDVRYAYGLGLRVNTPIGPVRVDYARKWNVPRLLNESMERWHLALGHAF